jgi:hypothetical protein
LFFRKGSSLAQAAKPAILIRARHPSDLTIHRPAQDNRGLGADRPEYDTFSPPPSSRRPTTEHSLRYEFYTQAWKAVNRKGHASVRPTLIDTITRVLSEAVQANGRDKDKIALRHTRCNWERKGNPEALRSE